jgi:hypothetical protein
MGRRGIYHRCAYKAPDPTTNYEGSGPEFSRRGIAYCGAVTFFKASEREPSAAKRASCPKCAAALGKLILSRRYGERVRLEPAPAEVAKRFKSAFTFVLDGVPRGYIAAERGFGKGWDLYRLPYGKERSWRHWGDSITPARPGGPWGADKVPDDQPIQALHFGARDAMACGAVRAAEAGLLPTAEEQEERERERTAIREQEERERARHAEERAKEREAQRVEQEERRSTAIAGLEELGARADLTNLERAGLEAALRLIRG